MAGRSKANRHQIVIGIVLLVFIQLEVLAVICPAPCNCKIDDMSYVVHRANCNVDNNTVSVVSHTKRDGSCLFISCSGINYKCSDLPNFQVSDKRGWFVIVSSCTTKILACVSQMLSGQKINKLDVSNMTGSYTGEDIKGFRKMGDLRIHFRDSDTEIPEVMLNSMPLLTQVRIYGGNSILKPNIFHKSNLENLVMQSSNLKTIPDDAFNGSRLTDLELNDINIENITVGTFRGQYRLESLAITSNGNLKYIEPESFSGTPHLKHLSIKRAALGVLPDGLFLGAKNLELIWINDNTVTMSLQSLSLRTNTKKKLLNSKISSKTDQQISNTIILIELINNNIETLTKELFSETLYIKTIRLKTNKIKEIPEGLFSNLRHLIYVDLSENNIITLPGNLFTSLTKLETVLLDNNNLTEINLDIFNNTKLQTLSIASNKLKNIYASKSLKFSVVELNLSYNNITAVQDWLVESIVRMMNKNKNANTKPKIDLSHNNIANFIKDETRNFKNCFRINFHIKLSNNPFKCSCLVVTVLKEWYKDKNLIDYKEIECVDGKILSDIDAQELCNGTNALIGVIGSSCVITLIVFLCLIKTIGSRKKIKRNIKNILNYKDNTNNKRKEQDDAKIYDVFVSFAHKDNEIVTDILLPKLEQDYGQKVCVHYRDWIVGELIPDQIIKSVEDARKTIIILTENFLESDWGHLEFHTAHTRGIDEGRSKLIVILFDESIVNDVKLSAEMKSYLVINDYLTWNNPTFWEDLQKMLPRRGKKQKSKIALKVK